jgi:hypothetical protein
MQSHQMSSDCYTVETDRTDRFVYGPTGVRMGFGSDQPVWIMFVGIGEVFVRTVPETRVVAPLTGGWKVCHEGRFANKRVGYVHSRWGKRQRRTQQGKSQEDFCE